jgi:hypothetical protein
MVFVLRAGVGLPTMRPESDVRSYELRRGGRVIGYLQWQARSRAATGWYLRRGAGPARLLAVDAGLDGLARDALSDHDSWQERADSAAALSTPLALDAADRALRGGLASPPSRPLESGAYELHVTGLDPATLAIVCPALIAASAGDTSVLRGVFDDDAMCAVVRRVNLLGGRVLAIFRAHPRPTGTAADWSLGSTERRRAGRPAVAPS